MTSYDGQEGSLRQEPLTRRRILEAALALVDREGAEALTMRRLGRELGVAAMSLYNYVESRDELLDGLSEVLVGRIGQAPAGEDPRAGLRAFMDGIRRVATSHPAAFGLVGMRPLHTHEAFLPVERVLSALRRMGLVDEEAVHAYRALASYARGFALAEIAGFTLEASGHAPGTAAHPRELPRDVFPNIVELSAALAERHRDDAFASGMEILLAGIAARAEAARTEA